MDGRAMLVGILAVVAVGAAMMMWLVPAGAQTISVNVTNETVYVKFENLKVINFTSTIINLGWVNSTHLGCAYSCLYSYSPDSECKKIRVEVFDGTVLKYRADFIPSSNNTQLCPPSLKGMCVGYAVFNVTGFNSTVRVLVVNLDTNETRGPFTFEFPYKGPRLEGYAQYIPLIVPYGVLMSLAGRTSMKNVGIGLVIFGLIVPVMTVLGVSIKNLMLASSLSIILGVILIWMSNQ